LLVPRLWDDKSEFLGRAGFSSEEPERLLSALRKLVGENDAFEDGANRFGVFLRVDGEIEGPVGVRLPVTTIWLRWHTDGSVHFVTLKPRRG
jgi:Domain of unknown function (DUF6883)